MTAGDFLAHLSAKAQILWLRQQSTELLLTIHRAYGYGLADCSCPIVCPPCPEHTLTRFQLVARALWNEDRRRELADVSALRHRPPLNLGQLGALDDGKLFARAFPEFEGRPHCDCPYVMEPCEHARALVETPLHPEAMDELQRLLSAAGIVEPLEEPPQPITRSRCLTTQTKAAAMARRAPEGFGLYHPADRLRRGAMPPEYMRRLAQRMRNGALEPGEVALRGTA